jgi:hypothetical protein
LRNGTGSPGNTWAVYDGTVSSASRNTIGGLEVTINSTLDSNGFSGGNATNWGGIGGGGNHAGGTVASVSLFINPLTWTENIWIGRLPSDGNNTFAAQNFQLFNNGIYTGPASNLKAIFPDGTYWLHNIPWLSLSTSTAANQFLALFTTTPGDNIKKFWAGGFQWEAGSFSTSYIPTTGSTVTRAADVASITGTNFSSWYNQSAGSFFVDANHKGSSHFNNAIFLKVNNGTTNNQIKIFSVGADPYLYITYIAAEQAYIDAGSVSVGLPNKYAAGFTVNNFALSVNGATAVTDASGTSPMDMTQLTIGARLSGVGQPNGTIARLSYYPTRLQDFQLQQLTK